MADIEIAARALLRVPRAQRAAAMENMLIAAKTGDKYRKKLGKQHVQFGVGSLMSSAHNHPQAPRVQVFDDDAIDAFLHVFNALKARCHNHTL